jgi:hypothetical protein
MSTALRLPSICIRFPGPQSSFSRISLSDVEVAYVLGLDWRTHLVTPESDTRFLETWGSIPLEHMSSTDEEPCLLMRCYGTVRVVTQGKLQNLHNPDFDFHGRKQEVQTQIMGWEP